MSAYKCFRGAKEKRSRLSRYLAPDGFTFNGPFHRIQKLVRIETKWKDIDCGHITSNIDPNCEGCWFRRP